MQRTAVLWARLVVQHLDARLPAGDEARAAAGGVRDSPGRAATDALAARVTGPPDLTGLVSVWGPRGAPYRVAADDLAVFTRGALPRDDDAARTLLLHGAEDTDAAGIAPLEAIAVVAEAMADVVAAGGPTGRDAMHEALRAALPDPYLWWCRGCGTHHVHPQLWRVAGLVGRVRRDTDAPVRAVTYAAIEAPPDPAGDDAARDELTRRAVRAHGPLTRAELATWIGCGRADADARLDALAAELEEVDRDGTAAVALAVDAELLRDPPRPEGTRLLAPSDPLLDGRDRSTVVADAAARTRIWVAIGGPGVVLCDGEVVGTWRAKTASRRLVVTVEALPGQALPGAAQLEPEAEAVAAARGLARAEVTTS